MKKSENISHGTGRRKTSVARVYMRKGTGQYKINGRELENYFPLHLQRAEIKSPAETVKVEASYDFIINVKGGGIEGQAIAIRHGISRALVRMDEDSRKALKEKGFLTRDPRKRERKKYGHPGARKSFQFSKR